MFFIIINTLTELKVYSTISLHEFIFLNFEILISALFKFKIGTKTKQQFKIVQPRRSFM